MSSRGRDKPPALTPEESRYLDGQLPPDDARHLEHVLAADSQRRAALDLDREAVALWRDDVARGQLSRGDLTDHDLADRVLAGIARGRPAIVAPEAPAGGRWYAAAAAALIVVGIAGTVITRAERRDRPQTTAGVAGFGHMDAQVLEAFVSDRVVWSTEGGR